MCAKTKRFLRVHAGQYDFRRRIPDDLVYRFGKRKFIRSLGSLPYVEAVEKARRLTVITD